MAVLRDSGLFQGEWYLGYYQDVLAAGTEPLEHFCLIGWREGRRPNPRFDPAWYMQAYGEMIGEVNPLLDYIVSGEGLGRKPAPDFDPMEYRFRHGLAYAESPLRHYLAESGEAAAGYDELPADFDPALYIEANPDVATAGLNPAWHFIHHGREEGRQLKPTSRRDVTATEDQTRVSSDDVPAETGATARGWRDSIALYNAFASDYDAAFDAPGHRKAYDLLAWDCVSRLLPATPGVIVDAGCGTGRWVGRLLSLGHRVIGIEPAPEMVSVLQAKRYGPDFTLLPENMEAADLDPASADLVMAMGSVQYTRDPADMIRRFAAWAKPGGWVCVQVDSLVALVLELIRMGKAQESLSRLRARRGVFTLGSLQADLYLYDSRTLQSHFAAAGLADISCRGLLVTSSAWGRDGLIEAMAADEAAFLDLESELSSFPVMADAGKHIFVWGRRPL